MAEVHTNPARERPYRGVGGELRGDKLAVVSTDEKRTWPLAAGVLLVIVVGTAGWFLLTSLPDLMNDLFGLVIDLLLGPET